MTVPADLYRATEAGKLMLAQLRQLIAIEAIGAKVIGPTFDEAVRLARVRQLSLMALGAGLELLVELLAVWPGCGVSVRRPDLTATVRDLRDRLNALLCRTIAAQLLVMTSAAPGADGTQRMQFTFRRGEPVLTELHGAYGVLGLYVNQVVQLTRMDHQSAR